MRVRDSKGRVKEYATADTYRHRAEERATRSDYFDGRFPTRLAPEVALQICHRLADHSPEWRALHFAQRPDHAALFAAFEAGTL